MQCNSWKPTHLAIEPEAIGVKCGAGSDGGGGGEVQGIQRDADAGIDGEDELLVALAPVLDDGNVAGRSGRLRHHPCLPFFPHHNNGNEDQNGRTHTQRRGEKGQRAVGPQMKADQPHAEDRKCRARASRTCIRVSLSPWRADVTKRDGLSRRTELLQKMVTPAKYLN